MKTLLLLTTAALLSAPMMADAGRRAAVKPEAKKITAAQAALQAALSATSSFGNCALTSSALVSVGTAGETAVELAAASLTTSPALVASANTQVQPTWAPPVLPTGGGYNTPNPTPPTPTNPPTTDAGTVIVDSGKPPVSSP